MPEVPRTVTELALDDAARELELALRATGEQPNQDECRLLLAQLWLETGRGKACNNHNPGNISASSKWPGDFFRPLWFTLDESSSPRLRELHELMLKGKAPSAFRAYGDFGAGFADYVHLLGSTFPSILTAARAGDAEAMGRAIKSSGYAPDAADSTGQSLALLSRSFEARGLFDALPKAPAAAAAPEPSCS